MPGLDDLKATLQKGPDVFEAASLAAALTSSDSKVKSIAKAVGEIAIYRLVPTAAALGGAFLGVRSAVKAVVQESGSLEAAFRRISQISLYQGQLEPLLKSAAAARQRLAELMQYSERSPFSLSNVVQASKALEIFTRGADSGSRTLALAGNAARTAGVGIDQTAYAIGALYRALQSGQPIQSAAGELEQMGLVSAKTVQDVTRLQETGASFSQVWQAVKDDIAANSKSTSDYSDSLEGLQKKADTAKERLKAAFGTPFMDSQKTAMQNTIAVMENLTPVASTLANTLSTVVTFGSNLASGFARLVTSIPGFSTVVGIASKGIIVFGGAMLAIGIPQFIQRVAAAISLVADYGRTVSFASIRTSLLKVETEALSRATAASAAGATIASRAYGLVATGASKIAGALDGAGGKLAKFAAGLVFSPAVWLAAAAAIVGALWQMHERAEENAKALRDLRKEDEDVIASLERQIGAMRTLDDAQQAAADSAKALAEARKKLVELEGKRAPTDQQNEAKRQIKRIEQQQKEIENRKKNDGLAPGSERERVLRTEAQRNLQLEEQRKQNEIDDAEGPRKLVLLQRRQTEEQKKAASGRTLAEERARVNEKNRDIDIKETDVRSKSDSFGEAYDRLVSKATAHGAGDALHATGKIYDDAVKNGASSYDARYQQIAQLTAVRSVSTDPNRRKYLAEAIQLLEKQQSEELKLKLLEEQRAEINRKSQSEIIRAEQQVRDDVKSGKITPEQAADRNREIITKKIDLEENQAQHELNAQREKQEIERETRNRKLHEIDINAEKEILKLRSEGLERTEQESKIRTDALEKQRDLLNAAGKTDEAQEVQRKIDAEKQALEMTEKRARIQREADEAHLKVLEKQNESAEKALHGDYVGAAKAQEEAEKLADKQAYEENVRQKIASGNYTKEQAEKAARKEEDDRIAQREIERKQYAKDKAREVEEGQLRRGLHPGDTQKAQRMEDEDAFRRHYLDNVNKLGGQNSQLAAQLALGETSNQIYASQQGPVVSSIQRIGGGGGAYDGGGDPQKRIETIQKEMVQLLRRIADHGDRGNSAAARNQPQPDAHSY